MSDDLRAVVVTALLLAGAPSVATAAAERAPSLAQAEQPAPAPNPPPTPAGAEPAKTVLEKHESQSILGKVVRDSSGKEMGRIVNVIVDRSSQPRAVVIDFGGFLGVGSRKIAVDWSALRFTAGEKSEPITLDLTRDQVKAAPEFKDGQPVVVLGPAGGTRPLPSGDTEKAEP